jgi:hypothetical protein
MRDWTIQRLRANEVIRSAYIRITCSWEALCNKGQQGLVCVKGPFVTISSPR